MKVKENFINIHIFVILLGITLSEKTFFADSQRGQSRIRPQNIGHYRGTRDSGCRKSRILEIAVFNLTSNCQNLSSDISYQLL